MSRTGPRWKSIPNISDLINDGEITIGNLRPVGCVATAVDQDCTCAMFVRQHRKTLGVPEDVPQRDPGVQMAYGEAYPHAIDLSVGKLSVILLGQRSQRRRPSFQSARLRRKNGG